MNKQNGLEGDVQELLGKLIEGKQVPEVRASHVLDQVLPEVWFLPDDVRHIVYGSLHDHFPSESPEARQIEQAATNRDNYCAYLEHAHTT